MDTLVLNCWVYGDDSYTTFPVKIPRTETVGSLKKVVKDDNSVSFSSVDARHLSLYSIPMPDEKHFEATLKQWTFKGQTHLNERDILSVLNLSDSLVVVHAPNLGAERQKRHRSPSSDLEQTKRRKKSPDDQNLFWLQELYSKIWNRNDLTPTLFREVEVTRAHYDELQDRLNRKYPDRNSKQYKGKRVLNDKLDLLKQTNFPEALLPRHSDNNEDRIDDDDMEAGNGIGCDFEINSFFPFILRYLDLSALELKNKSDRFPLPLLRRQEYGHISELIDKNSSDNSLGSVVVSGQPGTGKTAYLYLKIIEFLITGRPFLYQTKDGTVYHATHNGVEAIRSFKAPETPVVAFVDGDEYTKPDDVIRHDLVQMVVATSPKGAYQPWLKQLEGGFISFTTIATSLWSPRELFLTGIFLYHRDITFELLKESTSYFGYNPRRCFEASSSVAKLEDKKTMFESAIVSAARGDILRLLTDAQTGDSDISHMIFQIFPTNTDTDTNRSLSKTQYEPVSRWALNFLLQRCEAENAHAAADFYYFLLGMPGSASFRGHLFERQVFNYLDGICTGHTFAIRGLTDSDQTWKCRGSVRHITFQEHTVFNEISEAVHDLKPRHLVPLVCNFPTMDSILYDPDDPDAIVTCIQITMNMDHAIGVKGLQLLQTWFKLRSPLQNLRPTNAKPWRFLFIVPLHMARTFKLQKLKGDTPNNVWAGKVHQYVLGLDDKTIFKDRSDSSTGEQQMTDVDNP